MEKHIEVMRKVLDLSETCQEAVEHIKSRLNEGELNETSSLMGDVVEGFYYMERALPGMLNVLPDNNIQFKMQRMQQSIVLMVTAYEVEKPGQVREKLQFNLQPALRSLRNELEAVLRPYTVS